MNALPPPGPERRRQLVRLGIVLVALVGVMWWRFWPSADAVPAAYGQSASNTRMPVTAPATAAAKPSAPPLPEPLRLGSLEPVPQAPSAGRNPFRYGVPPPPPPPPAPPPAPVMAPVPQPPPGPPPIPPIQLKFTAVMVVTDQTTGLPVKVAFLNDGKGGVFKVLEGQVIDGRYRLVRIGEESVIVEYLDGTGRRVIQIS